MFVAVDGTDEDFETRQPGRARQARKLRVQFRRHANADLRIVSDALSVYSSGRSTSLPGCFLLPSHNLTSSTLAAFVHPQILVRRKFHMASSTMGL
jgi:hypothetical protein